MKNHIFTIKKNKDKQDQRIILTCLAQPGAKNLSGKFYSDYITMVHNSLVDHINPSSILFTAGHNARLFVNNVDKEKNNIFHFTGWDAFNYAGEIDFVLRVFAQATEVAIITDFMNMDPETQSAICNLPNSTIFLTDDITGIGVTNPNNQYHFGYSKDEVQWAKIALFTGLELNLLRQYCRQNPKLFLFEILNLICKHKESNFQLEKSKAQLYSR